MDYIWFAAISFCHNRRTANVDFFPSKFGIFKASTTTTRALGKSTIVLSGWLCFFITRQQAARYLLPGLADPPMTSFLGRCTLWLSGSQCLFHPYAHKGCFRGIQIIIWIIPAPSTPPPTPNRMKKTDEKMRVSGLNLWDLLNALWLVGKGQV